MLAGPGPPRLLGNLTGWQLPLGSPGGEHTQVYALERPLWPPVSAGMGERARGWGLWAAVTGGTPFSFQSSQKSCEPEPSVSASQSLLEAAGPEPLSQHPQASRSRSSEPLSSLDLSHGSPVALEYLPFFRTYGTLLAVGELVPQPEACRDQEGDQTVRDPAFHEDSEPPSGFFPFYRSKEECFPRLGLPGRSCWGSQDPCTRKEALAGCVCRMTVSCACSVSGRGPGECV